MSNIVGAHARVSEALAQPSLDLLNGKWAALRLAVFQSAFSNERRVVPVERLHAQVETFLFEMSQAGIPVPDNATGRSLCSEWLNSKHWLFRDRTSDGTLVYSLTSAALHALDLIQRLALDRSLLSESRLNTIIEEARRWALKASPSAEDRIERLEVEIREREVERDRLLAGGPVDRATDDQMLDAYINLIDLVRSLPSDFKRVEETMLHMHRMIVRDLRDEDRPLAEVLDEYLAKQDNLLAETSEGRAYAGAFVLLRDEKLQDDLRRDLSTVLAHPAASSEAINNSEINEIRGTEAVIQQGIQDVLDQQRRLSATLRDHIANRDPLQERELNRVLRGINKELAVWMETAGPRSTVPIDLLPAGLEQVEHLRERLWDPADATPPRPLSDTEDEEEIAVPTLEELRAQGGPTLEALSSALDEAIESGSTTSLSDLFNGLPQELRRPVEIVGLLDLITQRSGFPDTTRQHAYEAIRPDGERVRFLGPAAALVTNIPANSTEADPNDP